ncbi:MAG: YitT family protein [Marinospirillum sp.]|uniref:YitT family protein n=1 Tax=Marinospirillum sp. TaxID=2183934 RepID=UPI001A035CD9|nr:YitT family protein [Marinospirillum sp.]MBE0505701.1 YitT family protein [Marinospirillum sp.]
MIEDNKHRQHSLVEDALALITATPLVALGITFYSHAELLTGSTAGLAFLIKYLTEWGFGPVFFVLNLPFYVLAFLRMGWKFTLRTFCAVGLVSVFAELTPQWVSLHQINPVYAALLGGMCMGLGMLMLFRHRASLGGVNILALYLQDRFNIRAGKFQMSVDLVIVLAALLVLPLDKVLLSIGGAAILNLILTLNHKPGRYQGVS